MTIKTKRTARFVKNVFKSIPAYISGKKSDIHGVSRVFWNTLVRYLYTKIHESYAIRSEGGTDELGNKWKPLSPNTIAQRPIGKKDLKGLRLTRKQSGTALRNRQRGLLSPEENRAWKLKYSKVLSQLMRRMPESKAKNIAAGVAWNYVKANGAMTKKKLLANRNVKIMRVTDTIFNSLQPSEGSPTQYRPRKNQIYNLVNGKLELGTLVEYAKYHNNSRPVIPENISESVQEGQALAMEEVKNHILRSVL